jgi:hypothetical protein
MANSSREIEMEMETETRKSSLLLKEGGTPLRLTGGGKSAAGLVKLFDLPVGFTIPGPRRAAAPLLLKEGAFLSQSNVP